MENKEFIELVARMRDFQKAYFKCRLPAQLDVCKKLEKEVDQAIANYQNPNKQTALF